MNEDLNVECAIDLQISSQRVRTEFDTQKKIIKKKISLNYISYLLRNGRDIILQQIRDHIKGKLSYQNNIKGLKVLRVAKTSFLQMHC